MGLLRSPIHLSVRGSEIAGREKARGRMMRIFRELRRIPVCRALSHGEAAWRGARLLTHLWDAGFSG